MKCDKVRESAAGYVDDELGSKEKLAVKQHAGECPHCAGDIKGQRIVKKLVHQGVPPEPVSPHTRARVMHALDRAEEQASSEAWYARLLAPQTVMVTALVAFLLVLLTIPLYFTYRHANMSRVASQDYQAEYMTINGEVICINCELMPTELAHHAHPDDHVTGLKMENGTLWSILKVGKGREIMDDEDMLNRRIQVRGHFYFRANVVDIEEYHQI